MGDKDYCMVCCVLELITHLVDADISLIRFAHSTQYQPQLSEISALLPRLACHRKTH